MNVIYPSGIPTSDKGAANGVATLDSGGKVPANQLPNSVMEFQGQYDITTNTPALSDGTGNNGDVYECSAAGTRNFGSGNITVAIKDQLMYNGSVWELSPASTIYARLSGGVVPVSQGGTNASSYTSPSSGISPIIYWDGTRFVTDSTVAHLGYHVASDTFYSGAVNMSSASTQTAKFTNTASSSSSAGAGMQGYSDDGAAMASGDRLGFYALGGATDASHTTSNSTALTAFATENWSGSATGSKMVVETTPNGSTTRIAAVTVDQDQKVILNANTATTVPYLDSNKKIQSSSVTPTELGYLSGATSAIQTQLDAKSPKDLTLNRQTASYALQASDVNKLVEMNVGSACNVTVNNSLFTAGNQILVSQYGAGQVTFVAGTGVTIRSASGKLKLTGQYSMATLVCISATEFYLAGDITA